MSAYNVSAIWLLLLEVGPCPWQIKDLETWQLLGTFADPSDPRGGAVHLYWEMDTSSLGAVEQGSAAAFIVNGWRSSGAYNSSMCFHGALDFSRFICMGCYNILQARACQWNRQLEYYEMAASLHYAWNHWCFSWQKSWNNIVSSSRTKSSSSS